MTTTELHAIAAIERHAQALHARLVVSEPVAQGWADDELTDLRACLEELQAEVDALHRVIDEYRVTVEMIEDTHAHGLTLDASSTDVYPDGEERAGGVGGAPTHEPSTRSELG